MISRTINEIERNSNIKIELIRLFHKIDNDVDLLNFITNYDQFGNPFDDKRYYFPIEGDIKNPLYKMNYITLKWQFLD